MTGSSTASSAWAPGRRRPQLRPPTFARSFAPCCPDGTKVPGRTGRKHLPDKGARGRGLSSPPSSRSYAVQTVTPLAHETWFVHHPDQYPLDWSALVRPAVL